MAAIKPRSSFTAMLLKRSNTKTEPKSPAIAETASPFKVKESDTTDLRSGSSAPANAAATADALTAATKETLIIEETKFEDPIEVELPQKKTDAVNK